VNNSSHTQKVKLLSKFSRANCGMRMRAITLFIFFQTIVLLAEPKLVSGANRESNPQRAITLYMEAEQKSPVDWKIPFFIGQLYKHKLKDCASAVGPYERAMEKSSYSEWLPVIEAGYCFAKLKRDDRALTTVEKYLAAGGAITTQNSRDFLAGMYSRNGLPEKALPFASKGSALWSRASTKTIRLDWRIPLDLALTKIRLASRDRIRITLPPDRPYQKLLAWSIIETPETINSGFSVNNNTIAIDDNRYVELCRGPNNWPKEILLHLEIEQKMSSMFKDGKPNIVAIKDLSSPLYEAAHLNPRNEYSLESPEFLSIASTASGTNDLLAVKTKALLNYLRANFKYDKRRVPRSEGALAVLRSGQGDCGFYSFMAMALLRTQGIPVRFVYGLNLLRKGTTHAIIEIYDSATNQWFPHDPIIASYYGVINPMYVVFSSDTDRHRKKIIDDIVHIDTPRFWWDGGTERHFDFSILVEGKEIHSSKQNPSDEDMEPSEKRPVSQPDE